MTRRGNRTIRSDSMMDNLWPCIAISVSLHVLVSLAVADGAVVGAMHASGQTSARTVDVRLSRISDNPNHRLTASGQLVGDGHWVPRESASGDLWKPGEANAAAVGLPLPDEFRDSDFLPRSRVSIPAVPTGPIVIPFPERAPDVGVGKVVVALFIDETGTVVRVRLDSSQVSGVLEEVAKSAFLHSQFRPAQKDGRVVKSLVRVEVTFAGPAAT